MAEQALGYDDLLAEAAHFLGYGRDSEDWSADQLVELDALVQAGVRHFYLPPLLPGQRAPHSWSFLKVPFQLVTTSGTEDYLLPEDFGFFEGPMTIASTSSIYTPVSICGEAEIRALRTASTESTGRPLKVAYRPRPADGIGGQRFELMIWPEPDGVYTLQCRYNVVTTWKLSATRPYPYGSHVHAETIKAAVLAKAEADMDDSRGVKWQMFLDLLQSSQAQDKRAQPEVLGYMNEGEECGFVRVSRGSVTYEGVTYE